jgi:hypothetical protein
MNSPYVSIIIPIYKVEPYLERCLKSFKAQTFADFEAILVDDGSPDNCGAICDAFAKEDPRFIPLHQPNGGVGKARNNGLERASGRFITYADPDDYVGPDYLAHMIDAQKRHDADLVIARYVSLSERTMQKVWQVPVTNEVFIRREDFGSALPELYKHQRIGTLYSKLYKREILEGHKYSETVKMRGDVMFVTQLLERTGSIEVINFSDYFYIRYAVGSITKQVDPDLFQTHIEINHAMEETMTRCGWMNEGMRDAIDKRFIGAAKLCVDSIRRGPWSLEEKGAYVERILEHPEFQAAVDRRQARYARKEVDLMRPGQGVEWVRHLDAAEGRRRPLGMLVRPVMAFLVKLRRLIRGEKHWL